MTLSKGQGHRSRSNGSGSAERFLLYCTLVLGMMYVSVISLRDMTISSFFMTFDLRLWPSSSVKVTFIFIIRWTLCCCVLVPCTKFVGSIKFEIWIIVCRKLKWRQNDVVTYSIFMKFKHKSTKGIFKRHTEFHFDWLTRELRYKVGQRHTDTHTNRQTHRQTAVKIWLFVHFCDLWPLPVTFSFC